MCDSYQTVGPGRQNESSQERAPKRIKLEAGDRASEADVTSLKKAHPGISWGCLGSLQFPGCRYLLW